MNSLLVKVSNLAMSRVAIVGVLVALSYFFTVYDTGETIVNEIASLKTQVSEETNKKVETEKILKKEEQMRADVALLAKSYEEVKSRIPLEFDAAELRTIVDQISRTNSLDIIKIDNNVGAVVNQSLVGSQDANLIDQVAVKYVLQGSYNQIARFVTQLAAVQKVIKVEDLRLNYTTNQKDGLNKQLSFDATIIGYKQAAEAKSAPKGDDK